MEFSAKRFLELILFALLYNQSIAMSFEDAFDRSQTLLEDEDSQHRELFLFRDQALKDCIR
jgi:hypothetical protein